NNLPTLSHSTCDIPSFSSSASFISEDSGYTHSPLSPSNHAVTETQYSYYDQVYQQYLAFATSSGANDDHPPEEGDEEAQLLTSEDYIEQFEIDDSDTPSSSLTTIKPNPRARSKSQLGPLRRLLSLIPGSSSSPQRQTINPVFPSIQSLPRRTLERLLPHQWQRTTLLSLCLALWLTTFSLSLIHSKGTLLDSDGEVVRHLDCVSTLWGGPGIECGVDGERCKPFGNVSFAFRCPADCRQVKVLNPRWVGREEVVYRPW
ncbi:hypothetical protein QBC45DRAFT_370322, partial [Copromyces sp. CBS 386.78]